MLGRVVGPLAPGGRRALEIAPRRDLPPPRDLPLAGQGGRPPEAARPTQARGARIRGDLALRGLAGANARLPEGAAGRPARSRPGSPVSAATRPLVPGPDR